MTSLTMLFACAVGIGSYVVRSQTHSLFHTLSFVRHFCWMLGLLLGRDLFVILVWNVGTIDQHSRCNSND